MTSVAEQQVERVADALWKRAYPHLHAQLPLTQHTQDSPARLMWEDLARAAIVALACDEITMPMLSALHRALPDRVGVIHPDELRVAVRAMFAARLAQAPEGERT